MGVDAVWVCHTCKVKYYPGISDIGSEQLYEDIAKDKLSYVDIEDMLPNFEYINNEAYIVFFRKLAQWLRKHDNHEVVIGNDHIDWDFIDYEYKVIYDWETEEECTLIKKVKKRALEAAEDYYHFEKCGAVPGIKNYYKGEMDAYFEVLKMLGVSKEELEEIEKKAKEAA